MADAPVWREAVHVTFQPREERDATPARSGWPSPVGSLRRESAAPRRTGVPFFLTARAALRGHAGTAWRARDDTCRP